MSRAMTGAALAAEVEAMRFVFDEVAEGRRLPVAEVEGVADALALEPYALARPAMIQARQEGPSDYLPVHAVNTASLALAFARSLEMNEEAVRLVAISALLHDIGMCRLPADIVNRAGPIDDAQRTQLKEHPVIGARVIIAADAGLALPAVVAFEHHLRQDGSGYPSVEPRRAPHRISRMVQLCDIWHALSTDRPYRSAWPQEVVLSFIAERAGFEFDSQLAPAFTRLIRRHTEPVL